MITASLVLYNTKEEDLVKVLECSQQSIIERVFVIDNSPTDRLKDIVGSLSDKVEYVFGQGNIGYGGAHNIGFQKAKDCDATYHIVLNPDIYFEPSTISSIESFLDGHNDVGLVLPKVIYPNGDLQYLIKLTVTAQVFNVSGTVIDSITKEKLRFRRPNHRL